MKNIIIGTAGHIDHGKTTLIKALTGRDTDTLKEEKKRGISIDLGFTYFDLPSGKRAGIVDVPGHEKFIKNMLAGASSIDILLLVISATEGIMPQTIEHMDILSFLNVKNSLIVLTKCDSVDFEFKEMVKDDTNKILKNYFIKNCEIIEVDSITKKGIDTLVSKIDFLTENTTSKDENLPARLNVDRVFSLKGFGTIVTGTLLEGKIEIDDELFLYPSNKLAKIRNIQVHGENVNCAYAGQRTAINISNLKVDDIKRGDVLAKNNSVKEAMMLDVKLSLVDNLKKELKNWDRLKLYHGTREILCRAVLLEKEVLKSGENCFAQLRLEESIVVKNKDPFVIRTYSPMFTIGGGVIIDVSYKKHKRFDKNIIDELKRKENGDLKIIIDEFILKNSNSSIEDILKYTGETKENILLEIENLINQNRIVKLNSSYIHKISFENLKDDIKKILYDYHKKNRLKLGIKKEELKSKLKDFNNKEFDILIDILANQKVIKIIDKMVALYDFDVILNQKQKEIENIVLSKVRESGIKNIPSINELNENNYYKEVVEYMIGKTLIKLDDLYVIDKETYEETKNKIINYLKENKEITLANLRDLTGASRKNCVIILENLDRNNITKRIENIRVLNEN